MSTDPSSPGPQLVNESEPQPPMPPGTSANGDIKPYIPAENTSLPEFTVQAIVLGIILALVMCTANIYVGLRAGMTVSAAIPASVISMAVLRGLLGRGTILENNVVHTLAGAGESLAAGIIFTVPALLILKQWEDFRYLETTLIAIAGGVMGVVMMIPLRRPMIIEQKELKYPEGVACAEVLKAGDRGGAHMYAIFGALAIGAGFRFVVAVLGVFKETVKWATRVGPTAFYAGLEISPMLAAVGFIVGFEISLLIFLGGVISFGLVLPILAMSTDLSGPNLVGTLAGGGGIYGQQVRYVGIGAMVVAGVYSIIKIAPSIGKAVTTVIHTARGTTDEASLPRTERGFSGLTLVGLLLVTLALSVVVYLRMTEDIVITILIAPVMFALAFFFVAVASYIVGLVGSSNSPVSGMAICTVLITAGLLLLLGKTGEAGMVATLGVAGVVCCAACTSGDICQDLKIGQIVGATPRALQGGEIIGAVIPALIIAPTMMLLNSAYGISGSTAEERPGSLPAPQANMFAGLVGGLFKAESTIPWHLVGFGAAIGVVAILIDRFILMPRKTKFRLYPMPLAVGMYLPLQVTAPMILGGLAFLFVEKQSKARGDSEEQQQAVVHNGLLFSSGLVAGEAIMGILVAVLIVCGLDLPFLEKVWLIPGGAAADIVSLLGLLAMIGLLVWQSLRKQAPAGAR